VVTGAERISDLWEAVARQLLGKGKGHSHLAGTRYGAAAALGEQVRHPHMVMVRNGLLDVFDYFYWPGKDYWRHFLDAFRGENSGRRRRRVGV
jgi:hypothetical protein